MIVSCDFDGVICDRQGIPTMDDWDNDQPKDGALDAINYLISLGHELYILTANGNHEKVVGWLNKWGFPKLEVTDKKKTGTKVYIDDRAIRFTNWNDVRKYFG